MMNQIALFEISEILKIDRLSLDESTESKLIRGISTDSRTLHSGEAFLALRGEKFDGHRFIETAIQNGATALIVEEKISVDLPQQIPQLIVPNTLEAYQKIARWWRDRFEIPIIGVTGSVGKTTTKELITAVLSTSGNVHKTVANYNNEIGVPKTLLDLHKNHDFAVIEMAMRAKGEIALLTEIARPTIGVITNVGTAHIGRLGSELAIAQAKCELLAQMPPDSSAILNHDNPLLLETAKTVWQGEIWTYGLEGGDIQGKIRDNQTLEVEGQIFPLPLPGRHNALNYLAAIAVAKLLNLDLNPLKEGIEVNLPSGRARKYELANDIVILDETYNAGLESMIAALHLLKETPGTRHIAVLGAMKELGERSAEFHYRVGETVKKLGIDQLLVLVDDPEPRAIAEGAKGISTMLCSTHDELVEALASLMTQGDRLLFKASHSVGLNRVVEQVRQSLCSHSK